MATYSQVKVGAKGNAVSELQKRLNNSGFALDTDGVFGSKTQQAVRDYQKKNGLTVDGIVGNETWSSLFGSGNEASPSASWNQQTQQSYPSYGNRPSYAPSQALNNAAAQLAQYEANKPGAYQSKYQDQIAGLLDKILNRDKFSYDAMSDPLYQQYKESYTQQGKLAMQDAMGDAAALTGGYGSSYGQTVGQQVYQQNLQKINDKIPELYNAAYGRYADEGNTMTQNLGILQGLDESDYGRYRDDVGDYYNELQYFYTKYSDMSQQELQRYMADQDAWESDRAYWYQREKDAQDQSNWEAEFGLAKQKAANSGTGNGKASNKDDTDDLLGGNLIDYGKALSTVMSVFTANGRDEGEARSAINKMLQNGMITSSDKKKLDDALKETIYKLSARYK